MQTIQFTRSHSAAGTTTRYMMHLLEENEKNEAQQADKTDPKVLNTFNNPPNETMLSAQPVIQPNVIKHYENAIDSLPLKTQSNPSFGGGFLGAAFFGKVAQWVGLAVSSETFGLLYESIANSVKADPSLNELKEKNDDFRYALDKVELAGKLQSTDSKRAKEHLKESLTHFHQVTQTRSSKLHPLHRAEASSFAMEVARQLKLKPTEIKHHADRTEELVNEVAKNVNNNDWLHEVSTSPVTSGILGGLTLVTHGLSALTGLALGEVVKHDVNRKHHELKEIESLRSHIQNIRQHTNRD